MPGPHFCIGVHGGGPCRAGTGGQAASIKGKCTFDPRCREKRCATHCKCARMGWRTGKNLGRARHIPVAQAKAKAKAKAAPKAMPKAKAKAMAGPVGHPPALRADVVPVVQDWYKQMLADVRGASEVLLATYMYDHPDLQALLVRRLSGRTPFSLEILIDKGVLEGNAPWYQRSRLTSLVSEGAVVHVCTGASPRQASS